MVEDVPSGEAKAIAVLPRRAATRETFMASRAGGELRGQMSLRAVKAARKGPVAGRIVWITSVGSWVQKRWQKLIDLRVILREGRQHAKAQTSVPQNELPRAGALLITTMNAELTKGARVGLFL